MPIRIEYIRGKPVERYYVPQHVWALDIRDEDYEAVRRFRKLNHDNKRIVTACNYVLGWMGDQKQKFTLPHTWPVELVEELDRAIWRRGGVIVD